MRHTPQRPAGSTPDAGAPAPAGGAARRQRSSCSAVTKPSCGGSDSRYAPRPHHLCGSPKQCRCRWLTLRGARGVRCSWGRELASERSAGRVRRCRRLAVRNVGGVRCSGGRRLGVVSPARRAGAGLRRRGRPHLLNGG